MSTSEHAHEPTVEKGSAAEHDDDDDELVVPRLGIRHPVVQVICTPSRSLRALYGPGPTCVLRMLRMSGNVSTFPSALDACSRERHSHRFNALMGLGGGGQLDPTTQDNGAYALAQLSVVHPNRPPSQPPSPCIPLSLAWPSSARLARAPSVRSAHILCRRLCRQQTGTASCFISRYLSAASIRVRH